MKTRTYVMLCFTVFVIIQIAGCTQSAPASTVTPAPTMKAPVPTSTDTVISSPSSLGTILTDARGMTLYFFASDIPGSGISTCSGNCLKFWPVFYTDSVTVSPPLSATDFSAMTRGDGALQTAYKGWPLYYFSKDTLAGNTKGENVLGNWSVAKPDYTIMYSQQPGMGTFLTDGNGRTLYYFARDTPDTTACTGACITTWPPFSSGPLVAPSILKSSDFTGGKRPDGIMQSFYKGHALYYFSKDTKTGDMKGQGVINSWFVADISGFVPAAPAPVTAVVSPTPSPTPTFDYSDSGSSSGY